MVVLVSFLLPSLSLIPSLLDLPKIVSFSPINEHCTSYYRLVVTQVNIGQIYQYGGVMFHIVPYYTSSRKNTINQKFQFVSSVIRMLFPTLCLVCSAVLSFAALCVVMWCGGDGDYPGDGGNCAGRPRGVRASCYPSVPEGSQCKNRGQGM